MSWKFTTILHGPRKKLGISWNEYGVMDYIYQTQTHPHTTSAGWCETPTGKIAYFLGLSKGSISGIRLRMKEKGLLESSENGRRWRATPAWFNVVYRSEIESSEGASVQKLTDSVQKLNGSGQKLNDTPIYNIIKEKENKEDSKDLRIKIGQTAAYILEQSSLNETLKAKNSAIRAAKFELLIQWMTYLNSRGSQVSTSQQLLALKEKIEKYDIDTLREAITEAYSGGYANFFPEATQQKKEKEIGNGLPTYWKPGIEQSIPTSRLNEYYRGLLAAGWRKEKYQGREYWGKPKAGARTGETTIKQLSKQ